MTRLDRMRQPRHLCGVLERLSLGQFRQSGLQNAPAATMRMFQKRLDSDVENSLEQAMLKSVEGVFRNGKIELLEPPPTDEASRVVVTFLPQIQAVDLANRGIDTGHTADLRRRFGR